jgi:HSP20 family protein
MNQSEASYGGVDETIGQVERLYRTLTGAAAPQGDAPYAPIPAEKDPMQHVEEQVSRLIEMLGDFGARPGLASAWAPSVCVWENESEILVTLDIPGLKRDQVEIVVQGSALTVSGVRPSRDGGMRLRSSEAPLGAFRRTLMIPAVRSGEPAAQMKDGVLEIRIPKAAAESVAPRTVPIH